MHATCFRVHAHDECAQADMKSWIHYFSSSIFAVHDVSSDAPYRCCYCRYAVTLDLFKIDIDELLPSPEKLGRSLLEKFVTQRFVLLEGQVKPPVFFSSRLGTISASTFDKLYGVILGKSKKAKTAENITIHRNSCNVRSQRWMQSYQSTKRRCSSPT